MLPKILKDKLLTGRTSLGNHPAFPPDDERKFIERIVEKECDALSKSCGSEKEEQAVSALSKLVSDAMKKEEPVKEALLTVCKKFVYGLFDIPQDTMKLELELVQNIDMSDIRDLPEPDEEYSFENVAEMDEITELIYQRRFMDALVCGASAIYASAARDYLQDVFDADPELPALYKKITDINTWLLYTSYGKNETGKKSGGRVDVYPGNDSTKSVIKAKGMIFPMLLSEAIKGVLELAVSKGLPEKNEKRAYILKKSDFRLAELWDLRLGIPLWKRVEHTLKKTGNTMKDVGLNFLFMELSCMEPEQFNSFMREVLACTKKGVSEMKSLTDAIIENKEMDRFDDFVRANNEKYVVNDDCFKPGEILSELSID